MQRQRRPKNDKPGKQYVAACPSRAEKSCFYFRKSTCKNRNRVCSGGAQSAFVPRVPAGNNTYTTPSREQHLSRLILGSTALDTGPAGRRLAPAPDLSNVSDATTYWREEPGRSAGQPPPGDGPIPPTSLQEGSRSLLRSCKVSPAENTGRRIWRILARRRFRIADHPASWKSEPKSVDLGPEYESRRQTSM